MGQRLVTVAVDAMGSDDAPDTEVKGALSALAEDPRLAVQLVGDASRLRDLLASNGVRDFRDRLSVTHASQVIEMTDPPSMAVKQKKQSSMRVCFDLVKSGQADALISAGNSGAMMACGLFVFGRTKGLERPAILGAFPTLKGRCALLDMGANVDPKPSVLVQFAVIGAVYARLRYGKARPRVGLLANGSESHKGTALTKDAYAALALLKDRPELGDFEFVGNVEGRDIFKGELDVIVTDGFTGNVVLKSAEGMAEAVFEMARQEVFRTGIWAKLGAALMRPALRRFKHRMDYAETGGAPLWGVEGTAMICHGGSNPKAIKNAVLTARDFARQDLGGKLKESLDRHRFLWRPDALSGAMTEAPGGNG